MLANLVFTKTDSLPEILFHYSSDPTVVLSGNKKSNLDSNLILTKNSNVSIDTIIKYYDVQLEFIPDTFYFGLIKNHIDIDSSSFSELLIKTKLTMGVVKYGYGGAQNNDFLTEKYGVKYYAGGCVNNPNEIERQYFRYMRRLLIIRNGSGWEKKYNKELRSIK